MSTKNSKSTAPVIRSAKPVSNRLFWVSRAAMVALGIEAALFLNCVASKNRLCKETYKVGTYIGTRMKGGAVDGFGAMFLVFVVLMFGFNMWGCDVRKKELIIDNVINHLGISPSVEDLKTGLQIWNYIQSFLNKDERAKIKKLCGAIDTTIDVNDQSAVQKWAQQIIDTLGPVLKRNEGIMGMMNNIAIGSCTFWHGSYRVRGC